MKETNQKATEWFNQWVTKVITEKSKENPKPDGFWYYDSLKKEYIYEIYKAEKQTEQ